MNIDKIVSTSLLEELKYMSKLYDDESFKHKVFRIYIKCRRRGKLAIADRILEKYKKELRMDLNFDSDIAISTMYAIITSQRINQSQTKKP